MEIRVKFAIAAVAATATTFGALFALVPTAANANPAAAAAGTPVAAAARRPAAATADHAIARGEYLVKITGCNDCHTPGYAESAGAIPASKWLTGSGVGFQGPWGVSYPSNLRLTVQNLDESQWLALARSPRLPPMPWFALRDMSDDDLRAVYRFIRSLGAQGGYAPAPVAPGQAAATPVINFMPQDPPVAVRRKAS